MSGAELRIGTVVTPQLVEAGPERARAFLERAAGAGLDHVFVGDHVSFHTGFGIDGMVQSALITGLEPTLEVMVGVYLLALRHPVPVARQIATLCQAAPGRFVLGVGVGGEDRHEFEVCGVDPASRGARTDESLGVLRQLLDGNPVTHDGFFYSFDDALILPAPEPRVPFLIGGRSDAAVRRTARHGDGWIGVWVSPRRFAEVVAEVEDGANEAGRLGVSWQHGLQVWVGVDDDRERARSRLARAMETMYRIPFERFERYSPAGTPAEIAAFLAPYAEAGCRRFNVMPVTTGLEAEVDAVAEIRERLLAG